MKCRRYDKHDDWNAGIWAMYDHGLRVLQVFGCDTPESCAALAEACENVVRMERMGKMLREMDSVYRLFAYSGKEWQHVQSNLKQYYRYTQRLQGDIRKYGWSPLARQLLLEKYRRGKSLGQQREHMSLDPMERLLQGYRTLGTVKEADTLAADDDPMERVLNDEW